MRNAGYVIYTVIFMLIIVFPFAGLLLPGSDSGEAMYAAEKQDPVPMPYPLSADGAPNVSYLGDMGAWFEDNMAFRDKLISAASLIKEYTTGSSADDKVIMGKDGWLYYHGTEDDFLGRGTMSNRELFDAAHNLRLMQDYVKDCGCEFLFAIAANKNSIYPQYMPYSYMYSQLSNASELAPFLDAAGINFVDLHDALSGQPDLYFVRDTHWNGKGALIGYNEIMNGLGLSHETYASTRWISRRDHIGDLEEMLYPGWPTPETDYYIDAPSDYTYDEIPETMRDPLIHTTNNAGTGRLYMFRDSFGDALIPLLSRHFADATYSMYRPWNLPEAVRQSGTDVVVEIVERNLKDLINRPAIIPAPEVDDVTVSSGSSAVESIRAQRDGPYICISGRIDPDVVMQTSQIVVRTEIDGKMRTCEPFYTSNEERLGNSFYMYIPADQNTAGSLYAEVCIGATHQNMQVVFSDTIEIGDKETRS